MDYEMEIKNIKEDLEKAKDLKTRSEIALENLEAEEKSLIEELEELGVKPENLEKEIHDLKVEIEEQIKAAKDLMPVELLDKIKK